MTTYSDDTLEAVMLGAACLDEDYANWFLDVDLDCLNMSECNRCIVGQTGAKYISVKDDERHHTYAGYDHLHGFDLDGEGDDWEQLAEAWDEQVRARIMAMDIGKEKPPIKVEPLEDPVPREQPAETPEPRTVPRKAPVTPEPKRTPVKR